MKHFTINFTPDDKTVSIHGGASLLEAAGKAGIVLDSPCGGRGTCGKCRVNIEPDGKQVLACQYKVESDLTVSIPESSRFFQQRILDYGLLAEIEIEPAVCKVFLEQVPKNPSQLEKLLSDTDPTRRYEVPKHLHDKIKQMHKTAAQGGVTVICHLKPELIDNCQPPECRYTVAGFEQADTTDRIYGLAVDVGTTTVVAKLIDMKTGKCLATSAETNPQSAYGADVISRINYVDTEDRQAELQTVIVDSVNGLIKNLCKQTGIEPENIYELCVVGNTTMNHLFLRYPVTQLGRAPYKAHSVESRDFNASEFGIDISDTGNIHTVENIAGFVGADTVAAGLAAEIGKTDKTTLLVDIGTNGELILVHKGELFAASCAAGPALEGAKISQGSRAIEGAVESVVINSDDIGIDVIGAGRAKSICGSGLIDAAAVARELGVLDASGRLLESDELEGKISGKILKRLMKVNDQPAFCLAFDNNGEPAVVLTQKDIRELQLAKAAIAAGIRLLCKKVGIEEGQLQQILLAGAFGNYIRRKNAVKIALLPDIEHERIRSIGNAAGSGAQMILLSRQMRKEAKTLSKKIKYEEIAHSPDFSMVYADSMMFG